MGDLSEAERAWWVPKRTKGSKVEEHSPKSSELGCWMVFVLPGTGNTALALGRSILKQQDRCVLKALNFNCYQLSRNRAALTVTGALKNM